MDDFETGIFQDAIPYIMEGTGEKVAIFFPGTMDMIVNLLSNPRGKIKEVREWLPRTYKLYILGYGKSTPGSDVTAYFADLFSTFINEKVGKPVTIAGMSYGGFVSIAFAAKFPKLTEKLVLLMSSYDVSESGKEFIKRSIALGEAFKAGEPGAYGKFIEIVGWICRRQVVKLAVKLMLKKSKQQVLDNLNPVDVIINAYKSIDNMDLDLKALLPAIEAETHVVGGTKDRVFSEELYAETARLIPHATLHLIQGVGHMCNIEDKKKYLAALAEFGWGQG